MSNIEGVNSGVWRARDLCVRTEQIVGGLVTGSNYIVVYDSLDSVVALCPTSPFNRRQNGKSVPRTSWSSVACQSRAVLSYYRPLSRPPPALSILGVVSSPSPVRRHLLLDIVLQ